METNNSRVGQDETSPEQPAEVAATSTGDAPREDGPVIDTVDQARSGEETSGASIDANATSDAPAATAAVAGTGTSSEGEASAPEAALSSAGRPESDSTAASTPDVAAESSDSLATDQVASADAAARADDAPELDVAPVHVEVRTCVTGEAAAASDPEGQQEAAVETDAEHEAAGGEPVADPVVPSGDLALTSQRPPTEAAPSRDLTDEATPEPGPVPDDRADLAADATVASGTVAPDPDTAPGTDKDDVEVADPGLGDAESEGAPEPAVPVPEVDAGRGGTPETDRATRRRHLLLAAVPLLVVGIITLAWAVDTVVLSGQVLRNVEVDGRPIGGSSEAALRGTVSEMAAEVAERPVTATAGDETYETSAGALGLTLDEEATVDAALDAGRDGFVLWRPFAWVGSLLSPHVVSPRYEVSEEQTAATLRLLQGADLHPAVEPTIRLGDDGFETVAGQPGVGIDPAQVVRRLPEAAGGSLDAPIVVTLGSDRVAPRFTDDQARDLADRANAMTADGLTIGVAGTTVDVPVEQLRSWIGPTVTDEGRLDLALDGDAVAAALPELFSALAVAPTDADVTLIDGQPGVTPSHDGVTCCGDAAASRIWAALTDGQARVELETEVATPARTTEQVQSWGITQPVGGSRAWRNGAEQAGPAPGFTTYHGCCASRVTNIHRMADLVRGAVIPPGGTFSINDHVGRRTTDKGFVPAGAIANGQHVQEVGGGVSQFATTTFNAAYFAGLDITSYQAHTEYFSRYPRGREATMGYPAPDLVLRNTTPYGMLIWTSYTDTSLTVTFYSTPWVTAEQTGIAESSYGNCRNVSTTRTRTYPDGTTKQDTFRATYRPGPGQFC